MSYLTTSLTKTVSVDIKTIYTAASAEEAEINLEIFENLLEIAIRLALYEELSNQDPTPFQWKFDRTKLTTLLAKIEARQKLLTVAQSTLKAVA